MNNYTLPALVGGVIVMLPTVWGTIKNWRRYGSNPATADEFKAMAIKLGPIGAMGAPGINLGKSRRSEEEVKRTKVTNVGWVWSFMKAFNGCCVCKVNTPANTPWWKPFKQMIVKGLLRTDFLYKDLYAAPRLDGPYHVTEMSYQFIVCSPECEQYIYLALLET